jgi:lysophospholipid acyltransferase (LPLAT)-like uncharacterized protein
LLKKIGRSRRVQHAIGALLAGYLKLVKATSRISVLGAGYAGVDAHAPGILTFWHGQHLIQTFMRRENDVCSVMISRSADGEINAHAAELLGMKVVRGSGAQRKDQLSKRGGVQALRALLTVLEAGEHVSMTADVPKISRVAGEGIITLAQLSGRPILPIAVVASRRIDFSSWDAASIALPFCRVAIVFGAPIAVPREANAQDKEAARCALQNELDRVYAQGYASFSQNDPGANRPSMIEARALQAAKALQTDKTLAANSPTPGANEA